MNIIIDLLSSFGVISAIYFVLLFGTNIFQINAFDGSGSIKECLKSCLKLALLGGIWTIAITIALGILIHALTGQVDPDLITHY
jgi:hypothetical protein